MTNSKRIAILEKEMADAKQRIESMENRLERAANTVAKIDPEHVAYRERHGRKFKKCST